VARTDAIELPLTERVVLALVAEGTTHGWALAQLLAADGPVGAIWTVRRPLVYRAVAQLIELGLLREAGEAPSVRGPRRTLLRVTPRGKRLAEAWLDEPVDHIRDVRTELLLKLLLHDRAGRDSSTLVQRQREVFVVIGHELEEQLASAKGFDAVLLRWRVESSSAALRFLTAIDNS
jgi:PadR family transcriptional regulator AphA